MMASAQTDIVAVEPLQARWEEHMTALLRPVVAHVERFLAQPGTRWPGPSGEALRSEMGCVGDTTHIATVS
jgi:hypothetical protein